MKINISTLLIGVVLMTTLNSCQNDFKSNSSSSKNFIEEPQSQKKFKGTEVINELSIKEHLQMYWKFFFEKAEKYPSTPLPQNKLRYSELFDGKSEGLKAAWLGHSSLLINIDGYSILTDPVFERKVSPIGPSRFNKNLPLKLSELDTIDIVIISHDHYDHLNKYSIQKLEKKTGVFVVPIGVGERLRKWGMPSEKIVELNWWGEFKFSQELTITATPAQHFSGRGLWDKNSTLWASWVIKSSKHSIFFSGDSGYFQGFKGIGDQYGPFDVTFLECGAYNKHWSNVHMFPEETVQAHFDLKGSILQPIHWATFNLSLHSWYEPIERLISSAFDRGAKISVPKIGEIVNYSAQLHPDLWWLKAM